METLFTCIIYPYMETLFTFIYNIYIELQKYEIICKIRTHERSLEDPALSYYIIVKKIITETYLAFSSSHTCILRYSMTCQITVTDILRL